MTVRWKKRQVAELLRKSGLPSLYTLVLTLYERIWKVCVARDDRSKDNFAPMVLKWFCCGFTDRIWPKLLYLHLQGNKQAGHWFTCNLLTSPAMFQPKIWSKYQGIQPWQGDFHEGNVFSSENSFFHLIWSGSQTSAAHHWLSHYCCFAYNLGVCSVL